MDSELLSLGSHCHGALLAVSGARKYLQRPLAVLIDPPSVVAATRVLLR